MALWRSPPSCRASSVWESSECMFTHLVLALGRGVWLDSAHLPSQVCYSEFFPFRHEPEASAPLPLVVRILIGMLQLVA